MRINLIFLILFIFFSGLSYGDVTSPRFKTSDPNNPGKCVYNKKIFKPGVYDKPELYEKPVCNRFICHENSDAQIVACTDDKKCLKTDISSTQPYPKCCECSETKTDVGPTYKQPKRIKLN